MLNEFKMSGELLVKLREENPTPKYIYDCVSNLLNFTKEKVAEFYCDEEGNAAVRIATPNHIAYYEIFLHVELKIIVWQEIVFDSTHALIYSNSYSSDTLHDLINQCEQIARM